MPKAESEVTLVLPVGFMVNVCVVKKVVSEIRKANTSKPEKKTKCKTPKSNECHLEPTCSWILEH